MTLSRLPGSYFTETVEEIITSDFTIKPLYIVQTATTIAALDDQIVQFDNVTALNTVVTAVTNHGLTETLKIIADSEAENNYNNSFYVYSVKTDTEAAFQNLLLDLIDYEDIQEVYYIEETKSSSGNNINKKSAALLQSAQDCAKRGVFRRAYIVPYGTVADAVTNKASGTDEAAVITAMTSITNGLTDGRINFLLPDKPGIMMGRINEADYDEDPGFVQVHSSITSLTYTFSYEQMVSLQNVGVMFLRKKMRQGVATYEINLGVTSSFQSTSIKGDALLMSRRIADQVLMSVKGAIDGHIKEKSTPRTRGELQTNVDNVVDMYIDDEDVISEGTYLEVVDSNKAYTVGLKGTIQPAGCMAIIEVDTVLANSE